MAVLFLQYWSREDVCFMGFDVSTRLAERVRQCVCTGIGMCTYVRTLSKSFNVARHGREGERERERARER